MGNEDISGDLFTVRVQAATLDEAEQIGRVALDKFFGQQTYTVVHTGGVWQETKGRGDHKRDVWAVYVEALRDA